MALDNEQALFEGSGYYPMGYTMLYCVANVDDCGASIPLYQYYSYELQGISSFFPKLAYCRLKAILAIYL